MHELTYAEVWPFGLGKTTGCSAVSRHPIDYPKFRTCSYDNALAETINGLYKAELIHRRAPWKTKESVELPTLQWVHWFNHIRLLEPIGSIPPAEAEENYYRQLAKSQETIVST